MLLFCFYLIFLSACASLSAQQQRGFTTLATERALLDVPFVPQDPHYCGPASASMLLQHRGQAAQQDDIAQSIYLPGRKGTLQFDLKAYLRQRGLLVSEVQPSLSALLGDVAAGHPVLVLQNLGWGPWSRWHYAVVIGYDLEAKHIILHTGNKQQHRVGFATFERTWARSQYWGIVATRPEDSLPPSVLPPQGNADKLLEAVYELESSPTPVTVNVLPIYQQMAKHFPEHSLSWFSLGNTLYEQGNEGQNCLSALKAFIRAAELQADAGYYNNIAYLAAELGCTDLYEKSLSCGLALEPGNRFLQDTQKAPPKPNSATNHTCPRLSCNATK